MSVLPEKERPAPPKVVVCIFPVVSADNKVAVATEKIVELEKVAVALCWVELLNVSTPVHVTLLAAVT